MFFIVQIDYIRSVAMSFFDSNYVRVHLFLTLFYDFFSTDLCSMDLIVPTAAAIRRRIPSCVRARILRRPPPPPPFSQPIQRPRSCRARLRLVRKL